MIDAERLGRVRSLMVKDGIDVLFCSLPENVLYLTGYWPIVGNATVVFPADGEATVFVPASEADQAAEGWLSDVRTFQDVRLVQEPHHTADTLELLGALWPEKRYGGKTVGYEGDFESVAAATAAESRLTTPKALQAYRDGTPHSRWIDATALLKAARIVKSQREIEQLRISAEVASMGLDAARDLISAGVSEAEIAGAVEGRIASRGVGYKNVTRARGYCSVMSGINAAHAGRPFGISTSKRVHVGEPIVVELVAVTNGYFVDVTRTFFIGPISERVAALFAVVEEAAQATIAAVKPGVRAAALDAIARKCIDRAAYGTTFSTRSVTASACSSAKDRRCTRRAKTSSNPEWRSRSSRRSTSPTSARCASKRI